MTDLPRVSRFAVDAIVRWLMERESMLRPPEATAAFLVLCVKLHQEGSPFPPRADAARHLGCSVALIDMALSQRLATGDITIELQTTPGMVKRRLSTIRHRMVRPSEEIIKLVVEEEAKEARGRRRKTKNNNSAPVDAG